MNIDIFPFKKKMDVFSVCKCLFVLECKLIVQKPYIVVWAAIGCFLVIKMKLLHTFKFVFPTDLWFETILEILFSFPFMSSGENASISQNASGTGQVTSSSVPISHGWATYGGTVRKMLSRKDSQQETQVTCPRTHAPLTPFAEPNATKSRKSSCSHLDDYL